VIKILVIEERTIETLPSIEIVIHPSEKIFLMSLGEFLQNSFSLDIFSTLKVDGVGLNAFETFYFFVAPKQALKRLCSVIFRIFLSLSKLKKFFVRFLWTL
jgi:hypothetical protein